MYWRYLEITNHSQTLNLLSGGIRCPLLPAWAIVWEQSNQKTRIIIYQAHLLANLLTIPLMYSLILWNNFLKKSSIMITSEYVSIKHEIIIWIKWPKKRKNWQNLKKRERVTNKRMANNKARLVWTNFKIVVRREHQEAECVNAVFWVHRDLWTQNAPSNM